MDRDKLYENLQPIMHEFVVAGHHPDNPDALRHLSDTVGYEPATLDDDGKPVPPSWDTSEPALALLAAVVAGRRRAPLPEWAVATLTAVCMRVVRYDAKGFDEALGFEPTSFRDVQQKTRKRELLKYEILKRVEVLIEGPDAWREAICEDFAVPDRDQVMAIYQTVAETIERDYPEFKVGRDVSQKIVGDMWRARNE